MSAVCCATQTQRKLLLRRFAVQNLHQTAAATSTWESQEVVLPPGGIIANQWVMIANDCVGRRNSGRTDFNASRRWAARDYRLRLWRITLTHQTC